MELDDELCLCFHVTRRKVENFIRIERPRAASEIAECGGAGTGCGWCRTYLKKLFEAARASGSDASLPASESYAAGRSKYIDAGQGVPPGGGHLPSVPEPPDSTPEK